ncbi:MAG: hypothetical protein ACOYXB_12690 [Bacteroidota bacterium]
MNSRLFILITIIFLFSCDYIGCQVVSDFLEYGIYMEIDSISEKEMLNNDVFENMYKYVQYAKEYLIITKEDSIKYGELNYQKLYSYIVFRDSCFKHEILENIRKEWEMEYNQYVNTYLNEYKNWKEKYGSPDFDSIVKIKVKELQLSRHDKGEDSIRIVSIFEIEPKKETISELYFSWMNIFEVRNDVKISVSSVFPKTKIISIKEPIEKKMFLEAKSEYLPLKYFPLETDLENTDMITSLTRIDSLKIAEVMIKNDLFTAPDYYVDYIINEDNLQLSLSKYLMTMVGIKYLSEVEYVVLKTDSMLRNYDELCFSFFNLNRQK